MRPRQGTEPSQLPTGREALTADAPGRGRRSGWAEAGDPGGGPEGPEERGALEFAQCTLAMCSSHT